MQLLAYNKKVGEADPNLCELATLRKLAWAPGGPDPCLQICRKLGPQRGLSKFAGRIRVQGLFPATLHSSKFLPPPHIEPQKQSLNSQIWDAYFHQLSKSI